MSNPCYPENEAVYGMDPNSSSAATNPSSFLYNLSILKDKVEEVQSVASIFGQHPEMGISRVGTLIQEIMVTASSMMFACQQMSLGLEHKTVGEEAFLADDHDWYVYGESYSNCKNNERVGKRERDVSGGSGEGNGSYELIEVEAAELLAKYTHYCQVCGKGFKRDANLRMHMRAHGDEYKSSAALTNPAKSVGGGAGNRKYSCPHEGCRWNKKHARFQPLKSMICVKNHYKRSHCPKMYVCKRCGRKQFSVLSDLRTHEKHCGHLKWRCSCGTTFSRKDKLMAHVALFLGHSPAPLPSPHVI